MKKRKIVFKIMCIIIATLLVFLGTIGIFVWSKLSKLEVEKLNVDTLAVNTDLLEDLNEDFNSNITKAEFDKVIKIVLFGSDSLNNNDMSSGRSDTIMICSINPNTRKINLISIPRDTYVDIEGYGKTKINHAYAYGKEQLSIKTINTNFNLDLTEYITINFEGVKYIIDSIGGINLNLTQEEIEYINKYSNYKINDSGNVLLNGEQVLAHSRNRTIGNDFVRTNRQRDIIKALIKKISLLSTNEIYELLDKSLSHVKTNINITEYISFLSEVLKYKDEYLNNINSTQVPNEMYSSGQMINGTYYFIADMEKARTDLYNIIYEK